ncbi:MAG: periplasmic heavy metal sensor [Pedosphaera sp.]|nr:periplasmic heavy metal sensor [Pedosphaera sp.]
MKTKYLLITLAAAVAVGGFTFINARAASAGGPGRQRGGPILQRAAERLNLTDAQKAQIKAELKSEKDSLAKIFTQLHEARKGLRESLHAKNATEASVRTSAAKVAAIEADLAVERLKLHGKIAPILTDDQRAKLAEMEARLDDFVTDAIGRLGERLAD